MLAYRQNGAQDAEQLLREAAINSRATIHAAEGTDQPGGRSPSRQLQAGAV